MPGGHPVAYENQPDNRRRGSGPTQRSTEGGRLPAVDSKRLHGAVGGGAGGTRQRSVRASSTPSATAPAVELRSTVGPSR